MAGELERVRSEYQRLIARNDEVDIPRSKGLSAQARAVYAEVQARGAVIQGAGLLARGASRLDHQLATELHRDVVETTQDIEEAENEYTGSRYRGLVDEASDIFAAHHLAHNAAYYQAFGDQVMRQLEEELSVPPPERPRFFRRNGGRQN